MSTLLTFAAGTCLVALVIVVTVLYLALREPKEPKS